MSDVDPPPRRARDRQLSVTITGPEGMLDAMAGLLRSEGYTVAKSPLEVVDLLLAQYLLENRGALPSKTSVLTLVQWFGKRPESRAPARSLAALADLSALVKEAVDLWHEWSTTDVTADDDRWASHTDRVHAWLERARKAIPASASKATKARAALRRYLKNKDRQ